MTLNVPCKRGCAYILCATSFVSLFVFFKEFLQEFDVFIGHICYGVGVGAVEIDEPEFWDYSCSLGLNGLQVALAKPTVD